MAITVTENAAQRVQKFLQNRGKGIGLRVGIKTSGCSGLSYLLEYADQTSAEDLIFESRGIKIIIDPKSFTYLDGTEIDYSREGFNEGFKFANPNAKASCGCGESFNV